MVVNDSSLQEHWWRSVSVKRLLVVVTVHATRPSDLMLLEICLCSVRSHHPHALTFLLDNRSPGAFEPRIARIARLAPQRVLLARQHESGFAFGALSVAVPWALEHGAQYLAYLQHTMSLVRPLMLPSTLSISSARHLCDQWMPCSTTTFFSFFRASL